MLGSLKQCLSLTIAFDPESKTDTGHICAKYLLYADLYICKSHPRWHSTFDEVVFFTTKEMLSESVSVACESAAFENGLHAYSPRICRRMNYGLRGCSRLPRYITVCKMLLCGTITRSIHSLGNSTSAIIAISSASNSQKSCSYFQGITVVT